MPIYAKKNVTCDIKLDEDVALPFDILKEQFEGFAETRGIDLDRVRISEGSIRGNFTDKSGVSFEIDIKPDGGKSRLDCSASKIMETGSDARTVGRSIEEFTQALFHG